MTLANTLLPGPPPRSLDLAAHRNDNGCHTSGVVGFVVWGQLGMDLEEAAWWGVSKTLLAGAWLAHGWRLQKVPRHS